MKKVLLFVLIASFLCLECQTKDDNYFHFKLIVYYQNGDTEVFKCKIVNSPRESADFYVTDDGTLKSSYTVLYINEKFSSHRNEITKGVRRFEVKE